MNRRTYQHGNAGALFLPTIGILTVVGLVLFSHYERSARRDMAHAHSNFTEALRAAQLSLTSRTIDEDAPLPANTGEWIALFNHHTEAPGGGPAFIVNKKGNPATGAVGVASTNFGTELHLTRPAFQILSEHQSVVKSLTENETL